MIGKLTLADQRKIAMGAARSQLKRAGFTCHEIDRTISAVAALEALDEILRIDPDTIAAQWYDIATTSHPHQIRLFHIDWKKYQDGYKLMDAGNDAIASGDSRKASKVLNKITRLMVNP